MQQASGVPRGLLRLLVLKLLAEKDISGVEIVEEIVQETRGFWKPSSGSIYPILARLRDKGCIKESSTGESGMKRYVLTDEGKTFFNKQIKLGQNFLTKLEYLAPLFLRGIRFNPEYENFRVAGEAAERLARAFIDAKITIQDKLTKQDGEKIAEIMNDCAENLENITQIIKEKELT